MNGGMGKPESRICPSRVQQDRLGQRVIRRLDFEDVVWQQPILGTQS